MSSISSISNYNFGTSYSGTASTVQRHQRRSTEEMAAELFSKLDTSSKGYIEQSDLESALSSLSSSSSSSSSTEGVSASEVFSQLDADGDGKVTEDEFASGLQTLAESLDTQYNQSRMLGGMPPPPPPGDDEGFTKDELTSQLSEIGSTDSTRSSLISSIVENFDTADTNQDGKVSFQEAMAYDSSSKTGTSTSSISTASTSTTTDTQSDSQVADARIFRQIMELMRAYGDSDSSAAVLSTLTSSISTSA